MRPSALSLKLLWCASSIALGLATASAAVAQTKSIKRSPPLMAAEPQKAGVSPERLARIERRNARDER